MNMTLWSPYREMEDLLDRYNTLAKGRGTDASHGFAEWSPTVDIEESEESFLIKADIPGVDKEDIKVNLDNGVLSITGEKRTETETGKGTKQHRTERFCGTFARHFTLPASIQPDKVDAHYKDGVLSLMIPKAEEAKPKSIDINVH